MTEEKLLEGLKQQKSEALEALILQYNRYVAAVIAVILGTSCCREDVEELASDVFVAVWNHGSLTVPFTLSEELVFQPEADLSNSFVDAKGTVAQVTVYASYISVLMNLEPFDDWCSRTGDDAWFRMGDALWGSDDEALGEERRTEYTELDAQVAYRRSWERALRELLSPDSYLTLRDGSVISLYDPQIIGGGDDDALEGTYTEDFELPAAVNLEEVESLTLGGVTYFPAG